MTKVFGGNKVVDSVDFKLFEGEVLALFGENGAGKSSVCNLIAGILRPDAGEIYLDGRKVSFFSPAEAINHGVICVPQNGNLIEEMTVAQNIYLSSQARKKANLVLANDKKIENAAGRLLDSISATLEVSKPVKELSSGEKRIVEIAKALALNPRILLLDESTDALTQGQSDELLKTIKKIKEKDISIIFVSHKIPEIYKVADRIAIFRNGSLVAFLESHEINFINLLNISVGEIYHNRYPKLKQKLGREVMRVESLSCSHLFRNISFSLHKGEIVGIAGLVGSGRSAIAKTIMGIFKKTEGNIILNGAKVEITSPRRAQELGIRYLPEDRLSQGIFSNFTVGENIAICPPEGLKHFILKPKQELQNVQDLIRRLVISPSSPNQDIRTLSGGNQQKTLFARIMSGKSMVSIMDEPTKGIDTGTKVEIYNLLNDFAAKGHAILLISSDIYELMGMSDRILILYNGCFVKELQKEEFTSQKIYYYATGTSDIE